MTVIETLNNSAEYRHRKQEELEMIFFNGKAKDLNFKELWLSWNFGRPIEPLEAIDFSRN